jgi:WXG100 family type VII secretion target
MNASILGGDPQQMQQLSVQFRNEGQQVADVASRITGTLANTVWTGPAADRFRQEWEGDFRQVLARLQEALERNAHVVDSRLRAITDATS